MKTLSIRNRLWAVMGILIGLMVIIAVDSINSMSRISREIELAQTGAYKLALSTMDLALWMHRSVSAIETAALAARKDLLERAKELDAHVDRKFAETRALTVSSKFSSQQIERVASLYQTVRSTGLEWVEATLKEDREREPRLARTFAHNQEELQSAVEQLRNNSNHLFNMAVKDISNLERSIAMRITAVSIIGVVLFITLAILLSRSITQPLARLLSVIQGIRNNPGRSARRVDICSRDEVGQLAIAFNGMLEDLETSQGQLQRYTKELEVQVAERTRELQKEKESLRASEEYLTTIWEATQAGILVIDSEAHEIVDVNPCAALLIGLPKDQILGRQCHQFICKAEKGKCPITNCHQQIDNSERVLINAAGQMIPILKTVVAVRRQDREYLIESFIEITPIKYAEEAFKAKKAAEAVSRAKSDLLATISYEIRTFLNGILGMAHLLLATGLQPRQHHFAEVIQSSGVGLLQMINDILDFSKIEAGKLELEVVEFNLREMVEETAQLLAERAHDKGLELVTDLPVRMPARLQGDPGRLRQVLVNLVENAIKFTARGEVVVRLQVLAQEDERVQLRLEVVDTGIGIAPAVQSHIFQSFVQADGSTTRRHGSTGLGLAISRQLVQLMGGEIGVESTPGVGSRFWFKVQLQCPTAVTTRPSFMTHPSLQGLRVLVVDDNATNREILQQQVTAWGMRVTAVDGGEQALAVLGAAAQAGEGYDVALLDMHMPGMDGLELARRLQVEPRFSALQRLMLTSGRLDEGAVQAAQVGLHGYLRKPVRQAELHATLCQLLGVPVGAASRATARIREAAVRFAGRVLVAEDNAVNQEVVLAMLELLGCQATVAGNGREALTLLRQDRYDLVLMDCQMPELDGFAATAALRRWEAATGRPRLPVIALTANAFQGVREECLVAGMDDYLRKPFDQDQLAAILQRWLSPSRTTADAAVLTPAAPRGVEPSLLEPEPLAKIRALQRPGAPSLLAKVISVYLATSPTLVQRLCEAVEQGNSTALREAAHSLKSSSANLGAAQLAELCKELEQMGRDGQLQDAAETLSTLQQHYLLVRAALTAQLPDQSPGFPSELQPALLFQGA